MYQLEVALDEKRKIFYPTGSRFDFEEEVRTIMVDGEPYHNVKRKQVTRLIGLQDITESGLGYLKLNGGVPFDIINGDTTEYLMFRPELIGICSRCYTGSDYVKTLSAILARYKDKFKIAGYAFGKNADVYLVGDQISFPLVRYSVDNHFVFFYQVDDFISSDRVLLRKNLLSVSKDFFQLALFQLDEKLKGWEKMSDSILREKIKRLSKR